MKNRIVMITGANAGIGKDTARQLALKPETQKIYLACRNPQKAAEAKASLEASTGRKIFEIIIMDVTQPASVRKAVGTLQEPIDAVVLNAGGIGGKQPQQQTPEGVTTITAVNLLGHVVLVDTLIAQEKLKHVVLFASSEAARGIKQTGMKRPELPSSSTEEFAQVFDGSFYGKDFDAMQVYGAIKYGGTLWMAAMARKYDNIKFLSISPGGTRGTEGFNDLPFAKRIFFKYVGMPIMMPLMGLSHSLEKGAKRFVDALENTALKSGVFYGSKENVLTGPLVDQSRIFADLNNTAYQDNAYKAIRSFIY